MKRDTSGACTGILIVIIILVGCLSATSVRASSPPQSQNNLKWKLVWLWSMYDKPDAEIVSQAKSLGFNVLEVRGPKMVEECHKQGIMAAGLLHFASAPKELAQVISPEEEKIAQQFSTGTPKNYQYGGEPLVKDEILQEDTVWCFDRPEALEFGKHEIDKLIAEGCDIIALDYIGYRNYHACFCPISLAKQEMYRKEHPGISASDAINAYSEECLVSFYDALVRYAHVKKPDIVITAHVYPYFAPDPIYGNRIPIDYCGQTVSWFFKPYWSLDKVRKHVDAVVKEGNKYHPRSIGTPFIGVYTLPPYSEHKKSAKRLREEIRIVKESGATAIQMAELGHILNDPALARVVREELNAQ